MISRILRGAETRATLKEPADALWDAWAGEKVYSGKRVGVDEALGLPAVWSAVQLLSSSVGSLPMIIYRGQGRDRIRARDSKRWQLLHDEPNSQQSADMFFEAVTGQLNLWGNCYAEKVKAAGVVGELWPINPARVGLEFDKAGRKRFSVDGESKTYGENTILHIPAFAPFGGAGISPIAYARQGLGTLAAKQEFQGRFYANNTHVGGVLSVQGQLSDVAARRVKAQFEQAHRGASKAGAIAVLEEGASFQPLGMPLRDQQFIESEQYSATQIAGIFQVPPQWIGGRTGDSLTYSTVEGWMLHYLKLSLMRWLVRIESGLKRDRDLFPDRDEYPEFLIEGLLRGASNERAQFYTQMNSIGVLSVNEIRELENRPPVDGGDTHNFQSAQPAQERSREGLMNVVDRITNNHVVSVDGQLTGDEEELS